MVKLLNPESWKKPKGYSNGVMVQGQQIYLAGQVGWNADEVFESLEFLPQCQQILENIVAILAQANAKPEHLVRMTWYVVDKEKYLTQQAELGRIYRNVIGNHFPAMTLVEVSGLIEVGALLEVEATAVVPAE
ncbi:MAG: RidA family protein [Gammaproteobacteria bacterium]|nr:RidA family protein [Gammaproteobacteria bacterium]